MLVPAIPLDEENRMTALRATGLLFSEPEERFDRATRIAARLFDMPISLVTLVADTCQWFKSVIGIDERQTPRDVSFCAHAILGEDTFVVENAAQDPRFADNPLVTGAPNIRFYAGHPLRTADGSRVGTLCVIDRSPRRLTPEQLSALRDLAGLVETEVQCGQANEEYRRLVLERDELRRKVSIDDLTGLWNRTAIRELLRAEMGRAKRGAPVSVAVIDADYFKHINDDNGHQAGDAALAEIATRIRQSVRDFDYVGRYGGDEFLAVLSNCRLEHAEKVCEQIRRVVADENIATPFASFRATVSIGIAASESGHDELEGIVGAADAALYRAKAKGRNRVEL